MAAIAFSALVLATAARAGPLENSLLDAVKTRDHATAQALLAQHVDPNLRFEDASTVLAWAVDRGDGEAVRMLLAAGADPNVADPDGTGPLTLACENPEASVIGPLLDAHADWKRAVRFDGVTALHLCARLASPEVLARLLDSGLEVDVRKAEQQTPLMFAASAGRLDNMAVLIKAKADVNATTSRGFTPLFFAVKGRSDAAVRALLDAGAKLNYVSKDDVSALRLALYDGQAGLAKTLILRGASTAGWDDNGDTTLHAAVRTGDPELVRLLLARGADPNGLSRLPYQLKPVDPDGAVAKITPHDYAALGYTPKIVVGRIEGGGPPAPEPPEPLTPLLTAATAGSVEMMRLLIAAGAKPDFTSTDGNNILLAASASGKLAAVQYAVDLHPSVGDVRQDGSSVMLLAMMSRSPESEKILRFLADKGAPLDIKNKSGYSPLVISKFLGPEMEGLFQEFQKKRNGVKIAAEKTIPSSAPKPQRP